MHECMELAATPAGDRNNRLNSAAYSLARFVVAGQAREDAVVQALTIAAQTAGLGPFEIETTIASAFRARRTG